MKLLGFAFLLLCGYLLALLVLVGYTVRMLTRPPRRTYAWAVARAIPGDPGELSPPRTFRAFTFKSRNRELSAWDLAGDLPDGPTFIITGGWGESKVTMLNRARSLAPHAGRLILWDLPGHGDSPGTSSLGAHESEDLLELCKATASDSIVLYGYSLGAGISVEAAARDQSPAIRAVICEAPYRLPITPARNVLSQYGIPHGLSFKLSMMIVGLDLGYGLDFGTSKLYDRAAHASRLKMPLLVLHGEHDVICPAVDGEAIAQAAKGRFVTIAGADHVNLWHMDSAHSQALSAIDDFCREALNNRTIGDAKRLEQPAG